MAYNKKNKLLQMKKVCEVYQKQKLSGASTAYIYRTFIFPEFHISIATLYIYLSTPIAKELKELDAKDAHKRQQLSIF